MTGGDSIHLNCRNCGLTSFLTLWLAYVSPAIRAKRTYRFIDETKKALISAKNTRETLMRNGLYNY